MRKRKSSAAVVIASALAAHRLGGKVPRSRGKGAAAGGSGGFHVPSFAVVVASGRTLPGDPEECGSGRRRTGRA